VTDPVTLMWYCQSITSPEAYAALRAQESFV
jgi:hypothetical protein